MEINNSGSVNNATQQQTTTATNNSSIDEDGFLNLFIESLKNQNPMEPMSNAEMMQQLTQLTSIQNTMNMKDILTDLKDTVLGQNPISNYFDLINKNVKVETDNSFVEGTVIAVGSDNGKVVFELENGDSYEVSQLIGVS